MYVFIHLRIDVYIYVFVYVDILEELHNVEKAKEHDVYVTS